MRGRRSARRGAAWLLLVAGLTGLVGCGQDDGTGVRNLDSGAAPGLGSASGLGGGSTIATGCPEGSTEGASGADVTVALTEWDVEPGAAVPAGEVTLAAANQGGEAHELVVVRADAVADLPTDADGAVVEDELAPDALVGEIEAFPVDLTCAAGFDLDPGGYVFFCNLKETLSDGSVESHFAEGMARQVSVGG